MTLLSKLFGKPKRIQPTQEQDAEADDPLVPVPIPALGALLLNLEKQKRLPLTEIEVIQARDKAVCIMLPVSKKRAMDEKRGYEDIDPENVWPEWQSFREAAVRGDA
jgi:hypothetical protein